MRTMFLLACASISLAAGAAAACASSEDGDAEPPDQGPSAVLSDAATSEAAPDAAPGEPEPARCSAAGWCKTSLPDSDLVMRDIWPLRGRAFAVAESATLGIKVLEWDEATEGWKYIDDETQNEIGFGKYVGSIWAPNEDEVYYAVHPGTIYRGKRPVPPAAAWSWTRQRLEDNRHKADAADDPTHDHGHPTYTLLKSNYPALGVWGTGSDDVYAWYSNTIFRWKSEDGGVPAWVAEYVADDHETNEEHLFFLSAGGSRGDVWFSGARERDYNGPSTGNASTCAVAVRRTSESYRRIADGVLTPAPVYEPCKAKAGFLHVAGAYGWLTDLQPAGADRVIALMGPRDVAQISLENGSYAVTLSKVPNTVNFYSLWWAPNSVWLSGFGIVLRGNDLADGGAYDVSTISLTGAPLARPMFRIRGTDNNTNLWAIGVGYALHKTTP